MNNLLCGIRNDLVNFINENYFYNEINFQISINTLKELLIEIEEEFKEVK